MKLQLQIYIIFTLSVLLQLCLSNPQPSSRQRGTQNAKTTFDLTDPKNYYAIKLPKSFSEYINPKSKLDFNDASLFLARLQSEVWRLNKHGKKLQSTLKQTLYDHAKLESQQPFSRDISSRMGYIARPFTLYMKLKEQMDKDIPMIVETLRSDLKKVVKNKGSEYLTASKKTSLLIKNQILGFRKYKMSQDKAVLKKLGREFTTPSGLHETLIPLLESIYTNKLAFDLLRGVYFKFGTHLLERMKKEGKMPKEFSDRMKKSSSIIQKVWREVSGETNTYGKTRNVHVNSLVKVGDIISDYIFLQAIKELMQTDMVPRDGAGVSDFSIDLPDFSIDLPEIPLEGLECLELVGGCVEVVEFAWDALSFFITLPFRICGACLDGLDRF